MTDFARDAYARRHRAVKVRALIWALHVRLGPLSQDGYRKLAEKLRAWPRKDWLTLARDAGCRPPTWRKGVADTVEDVISALLDRAAGKVTGEPEPPDFSDLRGPLDEEDEVLEALAQEAAEREDAADDRGDQTDAERRADMLGPSVPSWSMR